MEEGWRWLLPFSPRGGDSKRFQTDLESGQLSGRLTLSKDPASLEETEEILDWRIPLVEVLVLDDMLGALRIADSVGKAQRWLVGGV